MTEEKKEEKQDEFKQERFAAEAALQQMYAEKWIDISLDTDRQLLTLSTAAIGLLATFITSKGISSTYQLMLLVVSVLAFTSVIASILYIFKLNRIHIAVQSSKQKPDESLMLFLDKAVRVLFFVGIFSAAVYALSIAVSDLDKNLITNKELKDDSKANRSAEEPSRSTDSKRKHSGSAFNRERQSSGHDQSSPEASSDASSTTDNGAASSKQPFNVKSNSESK